MKTLIVLLGLFSLNLSAQEFMTKRAYCELNAGSNARCEVCNFESYHPIHCQMSVRGQTLHGFWFQGAQQGMVAPGQCMYGYVYARNPFQDPLIFADAQAHCRL